MSKQNVFENIISSSVKRARQNILAGALDEFQQRMKILPTQIKQLNADPYMFIFDTLLTHKQSIDFVFSHYERMIDQNFLNPQKHASLLAQHFRKHLEHHSYKVIQIVMKFKNPNPIFFGVYFDIHNTIPMPQNILFNFRKVGEQWLARAFSFKKYPKPPYIYELTEGVLNFNNESSLPSLQDEEISINKYVGNIMKNIVLQIEDTLQHSQQPKKKKYGFCFMCSNPAGYYCKDTKIPVCSSDCKKAHINLIYNNNCLDYQFSNQFREQIQKLLFTNIKNKRNIALTVDFLCLICANSDYVPKYKFPHRQLLNSPIISERIWLLYLLYHYKKGLIFEHVFIDALTSEKGNIRQTAEHYFQKIAETDRLMQVFESMDFAGKKRLLPMLLKNVDQDNKIKIIYSLINYVFNSSNSIKSEVVKNYENINTRLLRAFNHEKDPIHTFSLIFGEDKWLQNYVKFAIRNETLINKNRLCQMIMKNDDYCRQFLRILVEPLKNSPVDEIIREIFYFVNIKVADKIYHLFSLLCQVYVPKQIFNENSFFQFVYFLMMIVTELHNPQVSKKITFPEYLLRVKSFDTQLYENHQQYLKSIFERLTQQPFSQLTRGILQYYPQNDLKSNSPGFSPVLALLQNWETFYDVMSEIDNDTTILYRCCSIFSSSPIFCQPFLQLLINKINPTSIVQEEHLVPSISSILQEQPNAVGGSWKLIFTVRQSTRSHIFQLGTLIHCSKELNDNNFMSFAKQFIHSCSMIPSSNLFSPCLKLMNFNKNRVQLVQRQIIQLFASEYNAYHQMQFMIGVFNLQIFEIGTIMLDVISINIVTEPFIVKGIIQIVEKHHKNIPQKTWTHILNKILMIGNGKWQQAFSQSLKRIPQCQKQFQQFNIQRAIIIPFDGSKQTINPELINKLHRLQSHIPQMKKNILKQFIRQENKDTIIKHFVYYCSLANVYSFLLEQQCTDKQYESIFYAIQSKLVEYSIIKMSSFVGFVVSALVQIQSQQIKNNYFVILQKVINLSKENKEQKEKGEQLIKRTQLLQSFLVICLIKQKKIKNNESLSEKLLTHVQGIHNWSKTLNEDYSFRVQLWKQQPFKQLKQMPAFYQHQNLSLVLKFLFKKYKNFDEIVQQLVVYFKDILSDFKRVMNEYIGQNKKKNKDKQSELGELNRKIGKIVGNMPQFMITIKDLVKENATVAQIGRLNSALTSVIESGLVNYNYKTGQFSRPGQKPNSVYQFYKYVNGENSENDV